MYYWEIDSYFKPYYQVSQNNLNWNQIHLGDEDKVSQGIYKHRVRPVYMRREKSDRESVMNIEKLVYLSLPLANI